MVEKMLLYLAAVSLTAVEGYYNSVQLQAAINHTLWLMQLQKNVLLLIPRAADFQIAPIHQYVCPVPRLR